MLTVDGEGNNSAKRCTCLAHTEAEICIEKNTGKDYLVGCWGCSLSRLYFCHRHPDCVLQLFIIAVKHRGSRCGRWLGCCSRVGLSLHRSCSQGHCQCLLQQVILIYCHGLCCTLNWRLCSRWQRLWLIGSIGSWRHLCLASCGRLQQLYYRQILTLTHSYLASAWIALP